VVKNSANFSFPEKVVIFGDESTQPKATITVFNSSGSTQIIGFYGYADSKGIRSIGYISVDSNCVVGWPKLMQDPLLSYTIYSKHQNLKEITFRFVIIVIIMFVIIMVTLAAAIYMKCVLRKQ